MKIIAVDASKCTGCRTCEVVCSLAHNRGQINPRRSRIRVYRDDVEGILAPVVASETSVEYRNMIPPQWQERGKAGDIYALQVLFSMSEEDCDLCGICSQWCVTSALQVKEV